MKPKIIVEIDFSLDCIDEDKFKDVLEAVFEIDTKKIEIYDSRLYSEQSEFAYTIADEINQIKADDFQANCRD